MGTGYGSCVCILVLSDPKFSGFVRVGDVCQTLTMNLRVSVFSNAS